MKKLLARTLLTALFLTGAGNLFAVVNVEVAVGGAAYEPEGGSAYKGATLDIQRNLGYDKIQRFTGRVKVKAPIIPGIYLQANPMKFDGNGVYNANFQYGDKTFSGNVPFTSSLQFDNVDVGLYYPLPFLKMATNEILNIELGLNARFIRFKSEFTQPSTGVSESKSQDGGVPMVYAGIQVQPIKRLKLESELRAVGYGGNRYSDFVIRAKVFVIAWAYLSAGYKVQNIVIDKDDVKTDIRFKGGVIEAGIDF